MVQVAGPGAAACYWKGDLISEQAECAAVKQRGTNPKSLGQCLSAGWNMLYMC